MPGPPRVPQKEQSLPSRVMPMLPPLRADAAMLLARHGSRGGSQRRTHPVDSGISGISGISRLSIGLPHVSVR